MLKEAVQTSYQRGADKPNIRGKPPDGQKQEKVKKIYLNADGGSWIKEGKRGGTSEKQAGQQPDKCVREEPS